MGKQGWKTYAVAGIMVVLSGVYSMGYITEEMYLGILGILNGLGLGALRDGVAKNGGKPPFFTG